MFLINKTVVPTVGVCDDCIRYSKVLYELTIPRDSGAISKRFCPECIIGLHSTLSKLDIVASKEATTLFEFFMWFRENGEKYMHLSVESMITKYLTK